MYTNICMYIYIYVCVYIHVHIRLAQPSRFFSCLHLLILLYPLAIKHGNRRKKNSGRLGFAGKSGTPKSILVDHHLSHLKKTLGLLLSSFHPGVRTFQAFTVSHPLAEDEQTWQLKSL